MAVTTQPPKILDAYYLLPTGANISHVNTLLGRVVENHIYPLQRYEPKDNIIPQKLVPGLMGNSNAIESVTEIPQQNQNREARGKLTDLVKAHATAIEGESVTVSAYLLKTYDMTQIKPNFVALKNNPQYLAAITELFEGTGRKRLPMITRVLVCEDMEVTTTKDSKKGAGFNIVIPGTAAATQGAVPKGLLDAEAGFEHEKTKTERKPKPKLIEKIKSWFHKKQESQKFEIVVSNNQQGGPYMEAKASAEEAATQTEEKAIEESSSDQTINENEEGAQH
ncbi:hypothetical protein B0O99DRAFT_693787 [Bisporella sp. PMI_857]|nr:hypothetical protein B0O99DRAFT_693787 [Bisporella sp. PMI_857]